MRKIILALVMMTFLMSMASASYPLEIHANDSIWSTTTGDSITPPQWFGFSFRTISETANFTLVNVTRGTTSVTQSRLLNESGGVLANMTISGSVWTYNLTNLSSNTVYRIEIFETSASTTRYNAWNPPQIGQNVIFLNGSVAGANSSGYYQGSILGLGTISYRASSNFLVNSVSYLTSAFETSLQNFSINISHADLTLSSSSFWYDGVQYSTSTTSSGPDTDVISLSLVSPLTGSPVTKDFKWSFIFTNSSGVFYENSTLYSQTLNPIVFNACNSTNKVSYLNFSFKDEKTLTDTNASIIADGFISLDSSSSVKKAFSFTNNTLRNNYSLCVSPSVGNVYLSSATLRYQQSPTYPIRSSNIDGTWSNQTTVRTLYLISFADSVLQTIQALNLVGGAISDVLLIFTRDISGSSVEVGRGTTDSGGVASFYLQPGLPHTLTVSKSGYSTQVFSITPSGSTPYTVQLSSSTNVGVTNFTLDGISWYITPSSGKLDDYSSSTNFNFYLSARKNNLIFPYCKAEIYDKDTESVLTSTVGGNSSTCNLTISYLINPESRTFGKLYVSFDGSWTLIESDASWFRMETNTSAWTNIKAFFEDFRSVEELGSGMRGEYSRVVIFFFLLVIVIGLASYYTQYDQIYPGASIFLICAIIGFASYGNFLTLEFGNSSITNTIEQYGVFAITLMFSIGYGLQSVARSLT